MGLLLVSNINYTSARPQKILFKGTKPCSYHLLSCKPAPQGTRQLVAIAMDSQGGGASRPRRGWETLDDDPLGQIVSRSDFLTSARLSGTCTKYFKRVRKYAWEKAMLVGLPCILEDEDVSLGVSPACRGLSCKLTPLEMPTLRGTRILSDEQVSDEFDH